MCLNLLSHLSYRLLSCVFSANPFLSWWRWDYKNIFLHAKSWIPGGKKSIFAAVIHWWRSPLCQFARVGTIDEFDVTMPLNNIRVTSQINCGDVTILSQKRLFLAPMAEPAIDNCCNGFVCSGHLIPCKTFNNTFFTVTSDFGVTHNAICQLFSWLANDFYSWLRHWWK